MYIILGILSLIPQIIINNQRSMETKVSDSTVSQGDKVTDELYPDVNQTTKHVSMPKYYCTADPKPICMHGFYGNYNNCLRFLHHSVKPIEGVVKYDFSTWNLFPSSTDQAKELAQKWSNSFEKRKDFANKFVVIFFHLKMKTIRVEVKTHHGNTLNQNINNSTNEPVENVVAPDVPTVNTQETKSNKPKYSNKFFKPFGFSKYFPPVQTNGGGYAYYNIPNPYYYQGCPPVPGSVPGYSSQFVQPVPQHKFNNSDRLSFFEPTFVNKKLQSKSP